MIYCPCCENSIDEEDSLPQTCPNCGSDLYLEEVIYQEMIAGSEAEPALV